MASRFKNVVKKATHEVRKQQSNMVAVVQQGLESMRVVKAFGRQDLEQEELGKVSRATVDAALKARRVKALLSPMIAIIVSLCTAVVLWRGSSLILAGTMTAGALIVFLSYLTQFFKPVKDLATITNQIAQTAVGVERVRGILDADIIIPEIADAVDPQAFRGENRIRRCGLRLCLRRSRAAACLFYDQAGPDGGNCRGDGWGQVHHREPDSPVL